MNARKTGMACAIAVAIGLTVVACNSDDSNVVDIGQGTVIRNVTVVNTRDGSLASRMAVVVDGGKITKVAPIEYVRTVGTAQDIDGTGKYVVPGFLDMHTHLFNASDTELPLLEQLFIANGITGIREMGGSPALVQRAAQFNADRAASKFDAPEILQIPGRIIGFPAALAFLVPDAGAPVAASTSAVAAGQEIQAQKAYGAGFIKTVAANRDAMLAILAEAKNQGLGVAGHLNPSVSARDASNAGWRAIEHLGGASTPALLDCSTDENSIRTTLINGNGVSSPPNPPVLTANAPSAPLFQRVFDTYDAGKCQTLAQTFAKNETWHVPTLIRNRTTRFVDDPLYRTDPNLIYVSKTSRAAWEAAAQRQLATFPASAIATYHQFFGLELSLTKLMKQNGVKMLAGSDTSIHPILSATWVIPGVSLHQEFALLASAGLSPLDILQMTTLNGAQFLNREATMGTVDEGKNADLVLLDANPIESAANLDKISAVFLKGKYFSTAALAKLKSDVATAYANQTPSAAERSAALTASAHVD